MSTTLANPAITVVTIDDHQLVREGIATFLSLQDGIEVIGQASTIKQGLHIVASLTPDVVLMDLQIGDKLAGISATATLKKHHPDCAVIILTSYHQDEYIFPAFEAGALSYLLKDILPDELADAVKKAAKQQPVFSTVVANKLLAQTREKQKISTHFDLSEREQQVLQLIASGQNNAEIAEQLFITIKTVRSHVSNILGKLQLRDRTQAAVHAWRNGLV